MPGRFLCGTDIQGFERSEMIVNVNPLQSCFYKMPKCITVECHLNEDKDQVHCRTVPLKSSLDPSRLERIPFSFLSGRSFFDFILDAIMASLSRAQKEQTLRVRVVFLEKQLGHVTHKNNDRPSQNLPPRKSSTLESDIARSRTTRSGSLSCLFPLKEGS